MTLTFMDFKPETGEEFGYPSHTHACPPPMSFSSSSSGYNSFMEVSVSDRTVSRTLPHPMEFDASSYNPYTPGSSERSASRAASIATDFGSSFGSVDSLAFDNLTPPSSAVSTCFPLDMEKLGELDGGMPYTPSRYNAMLEAALSSGGCTTQLAPHNVDQYPFADGLPSFFIPTPTGSVKSDGTGDMATAWAYNGDSPISFERKALSPHAAMAASMQQSSCEARRRLFTEGARQKTSVLHKIQESTAGIARPGAQMKRSRRAIPLLAEVSVAPSRKFKCDWPGCQSRFRRTEHLKRHIGS